MAFLSALMLLCAFPLSDAAGRLREFHLSNSKMYISEVQNYCKTNYTDIVTVYDHEDNEKLKELVKTINDSGAQSALIGAHTNNTKNTSKWSNGDDVTFTPFTENCTMGICGAVMKTAGSWELLPYNETKYFMCYNEGVDRASHNYSLIPLNKTWTEAQLYCRENHTDLVSITNEKENERIKNETKDSEFPFWIGLLYDYIEWIDGGKSAYRNIEIKQLAKERMYTITDGWTPVQLAGNYSTICYKSFIHVSTHNMTWEQALDHCKASGLLRIESRDDQIETERELRRQKISGPLWIGLRQSRLFGFWIWVNGLHVGPWTNWKGGRQPEHQISHHCGAMEKVDGTFKWTDKDCRSTFRVLCEVK